jgi:alpha-glucosidase
MVRGFCIVGSETARTDTTWEQPWGERRFVKDKHNEVLVRLEQNGHYAGRRMTLALPPVQ